METVDFKSIVALYLEILFWFSLSEVFFTIPSDWSWNVLGHFLSAAESYIDCISSSLESRCAARRSPYFDFWFKGLWTQGVGTPFWKQIFPNGIEMKSPDINAFEAGQHSILGILLATRRLVISAAQPTAFAQNNNLRAI
ncbi:hypothetical protein CISG_01659 [Coccidioides immitis RMSCC 3703]|uniref:Uncharacterized protein n=2 Tax=Coccidioides immitis TaxID=5501 RepID=A0A0J8R0F9_COCIT|nr:hypothetical protein CIRG_08298 [Coccidioides immitis RMSCC 2394]KMU78619.1 hypothetical protein CISG_01659 [Coccidioides immitis RMSCC 3703]